MSFYPALFFLLIVSLFSNKLQAFRSQLFRITRYAENFDTRLSKTVSIGPDRKLRIIAEDNLRDSAQVASQAHFENFNGLFLDQLNSKGKALGEAKISQHKAISNELNPLAVFTIEGRERPDSETNSTLLVHSGQFPNKALNSESSGLKKFLHPFELEFGAVPPSERPQFSFQVAKNWDRSRFGLARYFLAARIMEREFLAQKSFLANSDQYKLEDVVVYTHTGGPGEFQRDSLYKLFTSQKFGFNEYRAFRKGVSIKEGEKPLEENHYVLKTTLAKILEKFRKIKMLGDLDQFINKHNLGPEQAYKLLDLLRDEQYLQFSINEGDLILFDSILAKNNSTVIPKVIFEKLKRDISLEAIEDAFKIVNPVFRGIDQVLGNSILVNSTINPNNVGSLRTSRDFDIKTSQNKMLYALFATYKKYYLKLQEYEISDDEIQKTLLDVNFIFIDSKDRKVEFEKYGIQETDPQTIQNIAKPSEFPLTLPDQYKEVVRENETYYYVKGGDFINNLQMRNLGIDVNEIIFDDYNPDSYSGIFRTF